MWCSPSAIRSASARRSLGNRQRKGRGAWALLIMRISSRDASIKPATRRRARGRRGRLIGINTAILSRSGGNQGIGFAVPIIWRVS